MPCLTDALLDTAHEWLARNPGNTFRRVDDVFRGDDRSTLIHRAHCIRMIVEGALLPESRRSRKYCLAPYVVAQIAEMVNRQHEGVGNDHAADH